MICARLKARQYRWFPEKAIARGRAVWRPFGRARSFARFGRSVIRALDPEKYEAVPIGITKDGRWLVGTGAQKMLSEVLKSGERVSLPPDPTAAALVPLARSPDAPASRSMSFFPCCTALSAKTAPCKGCSNWPGLPYVGAGVLASAVGMDKDVQKRLFEQAGLAGCSLPRRSALGMGAEARRQY